MYAVPCSCGAAPCTLSSFVLHKNTIDKGIIAEARSEAIIVNIDQHVSAHTQCCSTCKDTLLGLFNGADACLALLHTAALHLVVSKLPQVKLLLLIVPMKAQPRDKEEAMAPAVSAHA